MMGRLLTVTLVVSSLALVALCCTLLVLFLPSEPNQQYTGNKFQNLVGTTLRFARPLKFFVGMAGLLLSIRKLAMGSCSNFLLIGSIFI